LLNLLTRVFTKLNKFKLTLNIDDELISCELFDVHDFFVFC